MFRFLLGMPQGKAKDMRFSPKAMQKLYGRSVNVRAPGNFMRELTRKAERAGGQRQVIDVFRLKTSQYDHSTNTFTRKKPVLAFLFFAGYTGQDSLPTR